MRIALLALAAALVPVDALRPAGRPRVSTAPRMMAKELVIWDCDGVLVDSEALLKTAEVEALHAAGFTEVTRDDCNRMFSGFAPEAGAANFEREFGKPLPDHFFRDQIAGSLDLFRERLEPLNAKTVLALHAADRVQVVASGSPRDRVIVCLEKAGISQCFKPEEVFS